MAGSQSTRVIVVHGIGGQNKGDVLSDIVEPVIGYMNRRLRDPASGAGLLLLEDTNRRGWRPSSLTARLPSQRWHFVEAWWAQEFRPISFYSSALWLLRSLKYMVNDFRGRTISGNSTFLRYGSLRVLSLVVWLALALLWWKLGLSHWGLTAVVGILLLTLVASTLLPWFWLSSAALSRALIWAFLAFPLFAAAFLVLVAGHALLLLLVLLKAVPGVNHIPVVGQALANLVEGVASFIAGGLGDFPAYADHLVKQVEISQPLARAILGTPGLGESVDGKTTDHLVILAHSLGAAITNDVLRWKLVREKLDEKQIPLTVITFGGATKKMWDLRSEETSVTGTLPRELRWFHVYGHWDPVSNGRLHQMLKEDPTIEGSFKPVTRTRIDYLHRKNRPSFWKSPGESDYEAAADGFSKGGCAEFVVNIGVTNRDSITEDHTSYWSNEEQVVSLVARLIWGPFGEPPEGSDENPFRVTPDEEKQRVDMRIARASATGILLRYLAVFVPILVFAGVCLAAHPLEAVPGPDEMDGEKTYLCQSFNGTTLLIEHWPGKANGIPCYMLQTFPDWAVEPLLNSAAAGALVLALGALSIGSFWCLERRRREKWVQSDEPMAQAAL